MEQILIKGRKVLKGDDPSFKEVSCFGLSTGSKINSIGYITGKTNTGGNMIDQFKEPITYSGVYTDNKGDDYMAFKLNDSDVSGWSLFNPKVGVYLLYGFCEERLYRTDDNIPKCWMLMPVFTGA